MNHRKSATPYLIILLLFFMISLLYSNRTEEIGEPVKIEVKTVQNDKEIITNKTLKVND